MGVHMDDGIPGFLSHSKLAAQVLRQAVTRAAEVCCPTITQSQGQADYQYLPLILQVAAGALTTLLLGIKPPQWDIASALHASRQDALQHACIKSPHSQGLLLISFQHPLPIRLSMTR